MKDSNKGSLLFQLICFAITVISTVSLVTKSIATREINPNLVINIPCMIICGYMYFNTRANSK